LIVRDHRQLDRIHIAIDRLAFFAHAPVVIDAQIAADADEPGLKIRAPIERTERLEDLDEDVLREVFGFLVPSDEFIRDVENFPPVLLDDGVPGELVALKTSLNERFNFPRRLGRWCGRQIRRHETLSGLVYATHDCGQLRAHRS